MRVDRRTDMNRLIVAFHNFAKAPKQGPLTETVLDLKVARDYNFRSCLCVFFFLENSAPHRQLSSWDNL